MLLRHLGVGLFGMTNIFISKTPVGVHNLFLTIATDLLTYCYGLKSCLTE